MKTIATGLLLTAILTCFAGAASAQTDSVVKELPISELEDRFQRTKRAKNYTDAVPYIKELAEREPTNVEYRFDYADTLRRLNRPDKFDAANAEFEKVLELDINFLEAYLGQAIIYAKQNNEKDATGKMLAAARKGYPVREMQRIPELQHYLAAKVRFFLKMVGTDVPEVGEIRDPFINPLPRIKVPGENGDVPSVKDVPEVVEGDPEPMQRDKAIKMSDLLVRIQKNLYSGAEEQARIEFQQFKELYHDVELGRITNKDYKEQMIETWKVALETVFPQLREIELRKFMEEARAGLDKLYEDLRKKDIEAAREHNAALVKILEPKLKEEEYQEKAMLFEAERATLMERVKILEEFHKNVRPFLKLTATITSSKVNIAMMETLFGGEVKKSSLMKTDSLPRMEEFVVTEIEEDLIRARYKGEEVEILMGRDFRAPQGP